MNTSTRSALWRRYGAVCALTLLGWLAAGGPASAHSRPAASPAAAYTIRFQVYDALPSNPITVSSKEVNAGHWRNEPSNANLVHIDDYTLLSNNGLATADITYRIGDTGYTFYVSGTRNFLGEHDASCVVKNPSRQNVTTPYKCEERNTTGADMDAYFVLEPSDAATHTVTNDDQFNRRDMLEAWCGGNSTYASCDSLKPSNIDDGLGAFRVTSDTLVNCTTSNSTQSLGYTDGTTTTNTVGTKVEISGKLFGIVQTKLEVSYQHAWAESHSVTKTVTITVAPGEYGWIATAQRMQNVTADFHVTLGNQTYDVPNVTVSAPMTSDGSNVYVTKTEKIDDKAGVCSGKDGASFLQPSPVAPVAGGLYNIAVAGSNQRVLSAPNSSRDAVQLELGQSSDGRNQQWRFIESPANADYFEVQSDNNPKLCLDLSGTDGKSILQWPCSHTDNELWSVTYDPTNRGFRISDKAEPDKALDTEGGKVEPGTKIVASDGAAARRWVFKRVG